MTSFLKTIENNFCEIKQIIKEGVDLKKRNKKFIQNVLQNGRIEFFLQDSQEFSFRFYFFF